MYVYLTVSFHCTWYIYMCVWIVVMHFTLHLLTESVWLSTRLILFFRYCLNQFYIHPHYLDRVIYQWIRCPILTRWVGIMMEILLYGHWGVSYVYILIVLVRETEFCKWFIYLDSLCWDVYMISILLNLLWDILATHA